MAELPTTEELATIGRQTIEAGLDPEGLGKVDTHAGSRNDIMVSVNANMYTRVGAYAADRVNARDPSSATGEDLDILAKDLYRTLRKQSAAAIGTIYLSRITTAATSIPIGSRFSAPATSTRPAITFEASETVPVAASALTADVPIVCSENGETGNIDLSDITAILDALPDEAWTINPSPVSPDVIGGGADEESDADLQKRLQARGLETDLQRGTSVAIEAGVAEVPGVSEWTIVEPLDGTVIAYCGDSAFSLPDDLRSAVETNLRAWRCLGIPVIVRAYGVSTVTHAVSIYMQRALSAYDLATLRTDAREAVKRYYDDREHPDEYIINTIEAAVFAIAPTDIQEVDVTGDDVLRLPESEYGALATLPRYIVSDSSISISFFGPQTG